MQQRFRVDGDIFENAPRVHADIFHTDKKRCVFKKIRIRVDEVLVTVLDAFRKRFICLLG